MAAYEKPKDPNWVCTFSLRRNPDKKDGQPEHLPCFILPDSEKMSKSGRPFRKNFTINDVWCEAAAYVQKDNSIKITIKKTSSTNAAPKQTTTADAGIGI